MTCNALEAIADAAHELIDDKKCKALWNAHDDWHELLEASREQVIAYTTTQRFREALGRFKD
jgi:hypothetical protein